MDNGVKIFCIPYAGGSASAYRCFKKYLNPQIEMVPVELSGRGTRMNEPLIDSVRENAKDIFEKINPELDGTPFIIFSHSMGTLITYDLISIIKGRSGMKPIHAFFSGRYTPDVIRAEEHYKLPDNEFLNMLKLYGGTPEEFYKYPELIKLFLPILRNDYKVIETYEFVESKELFDFNITVMAGREDCIVSREELEEWKRYTTKKCNIHIYNGDHFYLFKQPELVCDLINKEVQTWLQKEKG